MGRIASSNVSAAQSSMSTMVPSPRLRMTSHTACWMPLDSVSSRLRVISQVQRSAGPPRRASGFRPSRPGEIFNDGVSILHTEEHYVSRAASS